jgi:mannosyltransferase
MSAGGYAPSSRLAGWAPRSPRCVNLFQGQNTRITSTTVFEAVLSEPTAGSGSPGTPAGAGSRRARRRWCAGVLTLTLLAAVLRLAGLGKQPLWEDEAQTYWIAERPPVAILKALTHDCSPPLFYAITHVVAHTLGRTEWVLRLPSAVFGVVAVPLMAILARRLGGNCWIGVGAGLLLATSPLHIWHSQEARMYSLVVLLALASGWFLRSWTRGGHWFPYVLTTALLLSTHHFALYLVAAELGWIALRERPKRRGTALSVLAVLSAPVLWLLWVQAVSNGTGGWIGKPPWDAPVRTFGLLSLGVHADDRLVYGGVPLLVVAGAAVFVPTFLSGVRWWIRRDPLVVWLTLVVPALAFGVSHVVPSYTTGRYDIVILPFYIMVLAGSMRTARRFLLLGPLFLLVVAEPVTHYHLRYVKGAAREIAGQIQAAEEPTDLVVIAPEIHYSPFRYYYEGSLPCLPLTGGTSGGVVDYAHYGSRWSEGEVARALEQVGRAYRGGRIFLVWSPYKGTLAFKARLLEKFRLSRRRAYRTGSGYVELDVLERRPSASGTEELGGGLSDPRHSPRHG